MLSHETIARAARSFLNSVEYSPDFEVLEGDIVVTVDPTIEKIRPVILCAIVRGVDNGVSSKEKNDFIQSLMEHQEKLHLTLGRKRKFASIGVHDLTKLKPPFNVNGIAQLAAAESLKDKIFINKSVRHNFIYAKNIKKAELDIITWSLERSGVMALDKGGWYYQSITAGIHHEGDILEALHVLNKDVGIRGIFSDWPATVTFYANCMGLK